MALWVGQRSVRKHLAAYGEVNDCKGFPGKHLQTTRRHSLLPAERIDVAQYQHCQPKPIAQHLSRDGSGRNSTIQGPQLQNRHYSTKINTFPGQSTRRPTGISQERDIGDSPRRGTGVGAEHWASGVGGRASGSGLRVAGSGERQLPGYQHRRFEIDDLLIAPDRDKLLCRRVR